MGVVIPRAVALFLLCFGLAMAIAALADKNWADQSYIESRYGVYKIGLTQVVDSPRVGGDCPQYDLDDLGNGDECAWSNSLMGPQDEWKSAGEGALGLGAIGVILLGFAAIFTLIGLFAHKFTKVPAAICAFTSGIAFLIGALIYDNMRPSWGGDMGYNHPMGLYLAAGLMGEIAAIALWSADYTGVNKRAQYA